MASEQALWARYTKSRTLAARNALVELKMGLANSCARRFAKSRRVVDYDLISFAYEGLIQAVEGFQPERGWSFSTYAVARIYGAIKDGLRARYKGKPVSFVDPDVLARYAAPEEDEPDLDECPTEAWVMRVLPRPEGSVAVNHFVRGRSLGELEREGKGAASTLRRMRDRAAEALREALEKRASA